MRAILVFAAMLAAVATSADAKSKSQVGAYCLTQKAARGAYGDAYLRFRIVDGGRCWYAPGKAVAKRPAPKVRVAKLDPKPAPKTTTQPPPPAPLVVAPPLIANDLTHVQGALCGGPCPRFDLDGGPDRAVFRALCGGPCPDFRDTRIDDAFRAFGRAP